MLKFSDLSKVIRSGGEFSRREDDHYDVKRFFIFGPVWDVDQSAFLNLIDSTAILRDVFCDIQITPEESTAGS